MSFANTASRFNRGLGRARREPAAAVVARADQALYRAEKRGRNRVMA